jgi:putative beta-lysine N-acetyltransferase
MTDTTEGADQVTFEFDQIQRLDKGSVLQHGKLNDRIYLMKRGHAPSLDLIHELKAIASRNQYSKIFAKSGVGDLPAFVDEGFTIEAIVPGYFQGQGDLFMVCYYLQDERRHESASEEHVSVVELAKSKANTAPSRDEAVDPFNLRACRVDDIPRMGSIYRQVFPSYPFPIHDPEYLRNTMSDNVDYYCAEKDGRLVALASAEIDYAAKSAEMTDFATVPEFRGNGLATRLLSVMEDATRKKGIKTFYTIARALSAGMNVTFARNGYLFGGRLKNNTNISGSIQSMNIWYKNMC